MLEGLLQCWRWQGRSRTEQRSFEPFAVVDPQLLVLIPPPSLQALFAASELAVRVAVPDGMSAGARRMSELVVEDGRHAQVDVVAEDVQVDRCCQGLEHLSTELEAAAKQVPPIAKP